MFQVDRDGSRRLCAYQSADFPFSPHAAGNYTAPLLPPAVFYTLTLRNWGNIRTPTGNNWKVRGINCTLYICWLLSHWSKKVKGKVVAEVTDTINTDKYPSFWFLDVPRFPKKNPFCWKVTRLRPFILLLRVALKTKKSRDHWCDDTGRNRPKYWEWNLP